MERRGFLGALFGGAVAAVAAPFVAMVDKLGTEAAKRGLVREYPGQWVSYKFHYTVTPPREYVQMRGDDVVNVWRADGLGKWSRCAT